MNTETKRAIGLSARPNAMLYTDSERGMPLDRGQDVKIAAALLGSATLLRAAYANNLLKLIDTVKPERNRL